MTTPESKALAERLEDFRKRHWMRWAPQDNELVRAAIASLAASTPSVEPQAVPAALTDAGVYHAWCGDIEDEATLRRASGVMQNVLTDIADWEDKALAEAVEDAKRGIDAMIDRFAFASTPPEGAPK